MQNGQTNDESYDVDADDSDWWCQTKEDTDADVHSHILAILGGGRDAEGTDGACADSVVGADATLVMGEMVGIFHQCLSW